MSRLRSNLYANVLDKELQGHLDEAKKSLQKALVTAQKAHRQEGASEGRVRDTIRRLASSVRDLESVGRMFPELAEDTDLLPESVQTELFRKRQAAKQAAKQASKGEN